MNSLTNPSILFSLQIQKVISIGIALYSNLITFFVSLSNIADLLNFKGFLNEFFKPRA